MKRSQLTLFSGDKDVFSHILRLALVIKGAAYDVETIPSDYEEGVDVSTKDGKFKVFKATLVNKDLIVNDVRIAIEYLDDRYPHPALYPTDPERRTRFRILLKHLERELFPEIKRLEKRDVSEVHKAVKNILKLLYDLENIFDSKTQRIMDEELSIIDCIMAPVLYRLVRLYRYFPEIRFPESVEVYYKRIMANEKFRESQQVKSSLGFMNDASGR